MSDPASFFVPPRSAYTPQAPRLLSATLRANLLLGLPSGAGALGRAIHMAMMGDDLATVIGPRLE